MPFIHKGKEIKSAALIGFGKSNRSVFDYITSHYPDVKLTVRTKEQIDAPIGTRQFFGENIFSELLEDALFISPSVRRDLPKLFGKLLSSDTELFFEKNEKDVFAVTGSDGKSTTTALSALLLKSTYKNAYPVGNFGDPFTRHIDDEADTAYAAELSSFQLMYSSPKSKRALINNISKNHLNWHKDYDEYISAKENIIKNSAEAVFGLDSPITRKIAKSTAAYAVFSSELGERDIKAYNSQIFVYIKGGFVCRNGERILPIEKIRRSEKHNIQNLLAAVSLTDGYFNTGHLLHVASSFSGLEHRFELISSSCGISFYNSSIDTSPERTAVTVRALKSPAVVLLGGRTKNKNYEILREALSEISHAIVLTGENRYEIKDALLGIDVPIYMIEDFKDAVISAAELARTSGSLLFSPASVSFDRFQSFEERGNEFKRIIKTLK